MSLSTLYQKFIWTKLAESLGKKDAPVWISTVDCKDATMRVLGATVSVFGDGSIRITDCPLNSPAFQFLDKIKDECLNSSIEELCRVVADRFEDDRPAEKRHHGETDRKWLLLETTEEIKRLDAAMNRMVQLETDFHTAVANVRKELNYVRESLANRRNQCKET